MAIDVAGLTAVAVAGGGFAMPVAALLMPVVVAGATVQVPGVTVAGDVAL